MFKKIFISFFVLLFLIISGNSVFSFSIPVENIFVDIDSDYEYLHELQTLYDKGMIKPDSEGKFNPRDLLNRDEFVGILGEVTCDKCIQPNTSYDLINKYEEKQFFFDIDKNNPYFYCIADATTEGYVDGYHPSTACEDGTFKEQEKPFCPNNTIILEEAIAVILRTSGILSNEEAEQIRLDIFNGKVTEVLSEDVSPKNLDGSVYSFYPDFKKALEYEVVEVDNDGNLKTYYLVDIIDGKIRPKQAISKEMFLRIAYVTLKANSCEEKTESNLSLQIKVYDKVCTPEQNNCRASNLNDTVNTYDFSEEVYTTCKEGFTEPEGFIWRFYNSASGDEYKKYGRYIDNYKFLKEGERKIFLRVVDKCGNTAEAHNTINIGNMNVSIKASPIYGKGPLLVDYIGKISGGTYPYTYYWSFGDGNEGLGIKNENVFKINGIYETFLYVTDSLGKIGSASVLIHVLGEDDIIYDIDDNVVDIEVIDPDLDTDEDDIKDIDDVCPLIPGSVDNYGCPIEEELCEKESDCEGGYECDKKGICIPEEIEESCEYSGGDIIFGNVMCNSCPCNVFLDFTSTLRKCDIIFPAITSNDNKTIFSKGGLFQIK